MQRTLPYHGDETQQDQSHYHITDKDQSCRVPLSVINIGFFKGNDCGTGH